MKQSEIIVNGIQKKKVGRPRTVSDDDLAPAVSVRLPRDVLVQVDRLVTDDRKRSDVIRELVSEAMAARMMENSKRKK
jgi:hypothetical protein